MPGTTCIADYCQSGTCTATGQCVHGQKCSQNQDFKACVCKFSNYLALPLEILTHKDVLIRYNGVHFSSKLTCPKFLKIVKSDCYYV